MKNLFKIKQSLILILFFIYSANITAAQLNKFGVIPTLAPILKNTTPAIVNISIIPKKVEVINPLLEDPFFNRFFKDFHQFKQFDYEDLENKLKFISNTSQLEKIGNENKNYIFNYLNEKKLIDSFNMIIDGK